MSFTRKEPLSGGINLVRRLDRINFLSRWDQRQTATDQVRSTLIQQNVMNLKYLEQEQDVKFNGNARITALCWHPRYPYTFAVGSKHGDIAVGSVDRSCGTGTADWTQKTITEIEGSGGGNSITAMQFDENYAHILYRTSIDSTVSRVDLQQSSNVLKYHDLDSIQDWFTGMDIDFNSRTLIAGDNHGVVRLFNLNDGKPLGSHRFHKTKIHDVQFSKRDPNFLVTASIEAANTRGASPVKVWDMRMLGSEEPLLCLDHGVGVNVARFNPTNGSQLLTSDQNNEIRVYPFLPSLVGTPTPLIIEHHHKQFQHITAIKASWHPLADLIVIGKYPKKTATPFNERKSIQFFSAENGQCVGEIFQPKDIIASLNAFNSTGELLASGMSSQLVIWRPSITGNEDIDDTQTQDDDGPPDSNSMSQEVRNRLRGKNTRATRAGGNTTADRRRRAREYSPVSDDGENDENKKTKRAKKAPAGSKKTKSAKKK